MRNTLVALIAGTVLCGCLSDDGSGLIRDDLAANDPSGNSSPMISGNPPPAILVSEMYDFTPSAYDPDGDSLTFTITNKPTWASFDTKTGRLSGQPTLGNVGTIANIVISVSDGEASDSLRAFSVTVSQTALGNVTLSWVAPTQNADGSPLTDLAGYKIFYGKSSRTYSHEILISNSGMTTYVVDNLVPDTYYFAAKSFNTSGVESEYSGEAVRTVN
uniref:Fibronectin type III domain protein n=1 Tax=uncultured bacterium ws198A12 TaxID=1131830 RepID=I1X5J4_9BACT|nr:fibronectin type III domain protein [uncultured bacterium ws198A12]